MPTNSSRGHALRKFEVGLFCWLSCRLRNFTNSEFSKCLTAAFYPSHTSAPHSERPHDILKEFHHGNSLAQKSDKKLKQPDDIEAIHDIATAWIFRIKFSKTKKFVVLKTERLKTESGLVLQSIHRTFPTNVLALFFNHVPFSWTFRVFEKTEATNCVQT